MRCDKTVLGSCELTQRQAATSGEVHAFSGFVVHTWALLEATEEGWLESAAAYLNFFVGVPPELVRRVLGRMLH